MAGIKGLREVLKRDRRPGDIVFAWLFLIGSLFLVTQLGTQAPWKFGGNTFSQPAFWPTAAVTAMAGFGALHLVSSAFSPRMEGRWSEILTWVRSLEYAAWFMAYVFAVPRAGYLPTTILFAILLGLRAGYRSRKALLGVAATGTAIVVIFKSLLQVKIPGGAVYEWLPAELRSFFLTYL